MPRLATLTPTEIEQIIAEAFGQRADAALVTQFEPLLLDAGTDGARWIAQQLGQNQTVTTNARALRQLQELRQSTLAGINHTTSRRLSKRLAAAAEETEAAALKKAARRAVQEVFTKAASSRAPAISLLETSVFWHTGGNEQMRELGVPSSLWITQGDDLVRESHVYMHGQCRELEEAFESGDGNTLQFPGDPSAPISDTAGCRCEVWPQSSPCDARGLRPTARHFFAYWKAAQVARGHHERAMIRVLRGEFRAQRQTVTSALERALQD